MKIPEHARIKDGDPLVTFWNDAVAQISIESGIWVDIIFKYREPPNFLNRSISEVIFRVMDHEFEGLNDLKRALTNKVFL